MTEPENRAVAGREKRVTKSVIFGTSASDQRLLASLETLVAKGCYDSFGDLCKQALRHMLLLAEGRETPVTTAFLEQELRDLQLKVAALEGQVASLQGYSSHPLQSHGEQKQAIAPEPTNGHSISKLDPPLPEDPLLKRLSPLLEDF